MKLNSLKPADGARKGALAALESALAAKEEES